MRPSEAVITGYRRPLGVQQLTAAQLAAAVSLTIPTLPSGDSPGYLVAQCNGGIIRWRDDGTAPTAALGMRIPDQSELTYVGDMTKIQFIVESGSPELNYSLYA